MTVSRSAVVLAAFALAAGCASGPPAPPYPAFVQAEELADTFMASLPGIRAKRFAGDAEMRATSSRIDLPPDWRGTTGGSPGKALEIFVLQGQLRLADVMLSPGSYAYVPPGSLGFNMQTDAGARILFFLDDVAVGAMIRTPLIIDSGLIDWQAADVMGVFTKDLRMDPGSGARTWLERVEPGTVVPWQSTSISREGYLVAGQYQHSECVDGEPYTETYTSGGYFLRPANVVNGGPEASALTESIWLLRQNGSATTNSGLRCSAD